MNTLEQLLQNDLNHLVDRIAATIPTGMVADCAQQCPELTSRLREAETELSTMRRSLLQDYAAWREALQECGDLWALVEFAGEAPAPGERCAA